MRPRQFTVQGRSYLSPAMQASHSNLDRLAPSAIDLVRPGANVPGSARHARRDTRPASACVAGVTSGRRQQISLEDVLAQIRPGRVWHLNLSKEERSRLADRDAQIALAVIEHLLEARRKLVQGRPWEPFPLTGETFRRVALRLGERVGQKRSLQLIRRLRDAGVLVPASAYLGGSRIGPGYKVTLYLAVDRAAAPVGVGASSKGRRPTKQASVGNDHPVKSRTRRHLASCWGHQLFGTHDGRPPPGINRGTHGRWRRA